MYVWKISTDGRRRLFDPVWNGWKTWSLGDVGKGVMMVLGKRNDVQRRGKKMSDRPSIGDFLTNLDQPMPLGEKMSKLVRNLWRRVVLGQNCCGNHGEPGC